MPERPHATESLSEHSRPAKIVAFLYGAVVYLFVWIILIYIVGFVGNYFGPLKGSAWGDILPLKSIDTGPQEPFLVAFAINLALILILGLQHSLMPRKFFKRTITRLVPVHLERSTYIIFAIAVLALLMWQWRPIAGTLWDVENEFLRWALMALNIGGWVIVFVATFQVGHWKIFGVAQVIDFIENKPYTYDRPCHLSPDYFKAGWPVAYRGLWRYSRHPDFFGFVVAFWATPTMTVGHLMFAAGLTAYIFIGIFLLERNFKQLYGADYERYVASRSILIPWFAPTFHPSGAGASGPAKS
jgi:protein-S-isoprenylcysteine O-methyltransferase Ste14